jgi:hypothetical protein
MKIDFVRNRFIITCRVAENHLVKTIPSARFDKRTGAWSAQNLNRVCSALMGKFKRYLSPELQAICKVTLDKTKVKYKPFPAWYRFKTKPYIKQKEALDYTYNLRRSALFMGMGSGKTKTAIDKFSCHFTEGAIDCWIILAPVNIKSTWAKKQIPLHMPIDVPVFLLPEGRPKHADKVVQKASSLERFILIVGIESMSVGEKKGSAYASVRDLVINRKYGVTIDESHNCKGHDSLRSKNVQHLTANAAIMNIMTGTPQSQGFEDLYMQFEILDPNILGFGDFYSFRARYAIMGGYKNKQIISYENTEELMDLIAPFTFQCTKEEVVDLPPKIPKTVYVQLTPEQRKLYDQMDKEMEVVLPTKEKDIEIYVQHAMVKYGVLQQITGGFINYDDEECPIRYIGKDGNEKVKLKRAAQILVPPLKNPKIKELLAIAHENPDKRMIVWAKYRTEIVMLKEALEATFGAGCCSEYHGGIKPKLRDAEEAKFLGGETRFMLSNQQTGGVGTTWIEALITYFYSNGFRMIDREQSEDRNHRIGTTESVVYYDVVAEDTKDEDVLESIEAKKGLAQYLKDGLKKRLLTSARATGRMYLIEDRD